MHSIGLFVIFLTLGVHGIKVPQASNAHMKRFRTILIPYEKIVGKTNEITGLPPSHSMGDLLAYEPLSPENEDIFVFIPGSWAICQDYSEFLEFVAKSMHTLCVPYDNIHSIGSLCKGKGESCFIETRTLAYDGDFDNVTDNNQHERLLGALHFLAYSGGHSPKWADYLVDHDDGSDEPKWSSMRVSGHSQGAGSATLMGYVNKVARVVQFAGMCDNSNWTKAESKTPANRFYGLGHSGDMLCGAAYPHHWKNEGATKRHESVNVNVTDETASFKRISSSLDEAASLGAQTVISSIPYKCPTKEARIIDQLPFLKVQTCGVAGHETIVQDHYWLAGEHNPYAEDGIWNFVVGI